MVICNVADNEQNPTNCLQFIVPLHRVNHDGLSRAFVAGRNPFSFAHSCRALHRECSQKYEDENSRSISNTLLL